MVLRFPAEVLRQRLQRFQDELKAKEIDAAMIRTLSSFAYLAGVKWLRPSLLIPAEGEPVVFVAKGEEDGFREASWIGNVVTFSEGGDLMTKVSSAIRKAGYKVVGLEYGVERDAYILFYEMFKRLNPGVKVVDVGPILAEMRSIKDQYELEAVRKAGKIASKAVEAALESVRVGASETEIAAEAYAELLRMGSEKPVVYVNAGPQPRVHAEPFRDAKVEEGTFVNVTIGADYDWYYANISRSVFIGQPGEKARKAIKCIDEAYEYAMSETRGGVKFMDVIMGLDEIYSKYGFLEERVVGYAHGVGLQVEEYPITTIVPKHRFARVQPGIALAMIHSPLMLKGLGQVKLEDTFIVGSDGRLEKVTG